MRPDRKKPIKTAPGDATAAPASDVAADGGQDKPDRLLARSFDWLWIDPAAALIGAAVIASWSYGLVRDTGSILLDMNPDRSMASSVREAVEREGDRVADLHLWRLGPGHVGAIVSIVTAHARDVEFYRTRLARFKSLSHITVEVVHRS